MKWSDLENIAWDSNETTADWVKTLNDLRGLIDAADKEDKRSALAAKLDEFADRSNSDDLLTITKLDTSARKYARALRNTNIEERTKSLSAASDEYVSAVKEFSEATVGLKKEASLLRAERFVASIAALTQMISSLIVLSQAIGSKDDSSLVKAINEAVKSAQKLRSILETPS